MWEHMQESSFVSAKYVRDDLDQVFHGHNTWELREPTNPWHTPPTRHSDRPSTPPVAVAYPNSAPGDTTQTAMVQLQECDNGLKVLTWPQNPPDPDLIEQLLDVLDKVQSGEAQSCKVAGLTGSLPPRMPSMDWSSESSSLRGRTPLDKFWNIPWIGIWPGGYLEHFFSVLSCKEPTASEECHEGVM